MHWTHTILIMIATAGTVAAQTPTEQIPAQPWPAHPMAAIDVLQATVDKQSDRAIGVKQGPLLPAQFGDKPPIDYRWRSGDSGSNRLLFEEPRLERQGISRVPPVQLAQSSAAFFSRGLLFPFRFALGVHRKDQ